MPQVAPNYEELPEFLHIADQLVDRYPEVFGGIELNRIAAFAVTNKDRKDASKPIWEVVSIKPPVSILCNKDYTINVFQNSYEALDTKHKAVLVADALNAISTEGKGKVNPKDLKEYAVMIRTLGVDFMDNPDIPDILNDDVNWVR
tara:strand:- start:6401 stop:6838 length:438 start_codon:yes stop_codon:yes gene_type:complete